MSHSRTRNHLWKLSQGWRMESTANTNSRLTDEINRENRVIVDAWNRQWKLRHYRPKIVSENRVNVDLEIATEIWVRADLWSRQRQRIHERRIKPIAKIDSCLRHGIVKHTIWHSRTRNHIWNLSHCRTRNHLWKLSHGWRIESTANTNSRLTNEINRENRVIVDAWNRQWKLHHHRPEIVSENRVTVDLEMATEVWVTADCMESTASPNSGATHKTDSKNRFIFDAWNRQTHYACADP